MNPLDKVYPNSLIHLLLSLKIYSIYQNCQIALFPFTSSPMILNVRLVFPFILCSSGSEKRIGLAKERSSFYCLGSSKKSMSIFSLSFLSSTNENTIWLHHLPLHHISFEVLRKNVSPFIPKFRYFVVSL